MQPSSSLAITAARSSGLREIPWLVWCAALASTAVITAFYWDVSWHRSIGRDTFFTPPHCLLYLGALLACGASGCVILSQTFGKAQSARDGTVRVWGLRGPLGAFVSLWGGFAMLTSAPFDNWWHSAYGLDIVIQSPPHALLLVGAFFIAVGGLLLGLAHASSREQTSRGAVALVLYCGGFALILALAAFLEDSFNYLRHGARFYRVVAAVAPGILITVARATGQRRGATAVALVYTVFTLLLIAILPLFPAEPRLGPVLRSVTHFVPPPFPLLILPAALALDVIAERCTGRSLWLQALSCGSGFLLIFAALQWPFANFLHTRWADNRLFVANSFAYFQGESSPAVRRIFWPTEASVPEFWCGMGAALVLAVCATRAGLGLGRWLRELRR